MLVPSGVWLSRLGKVERNGICQYFCSWRSLLKISAPAAYILRLVNISSCIPRHFSNRCFYGMSWQDFLLCCVLWSENSIFYHSLGLPKTCQLILKLPRVKPCDILKNCVAKPHQFSKPNIMGTCLHSAGPSCLVCLMWDLLLSLFRACSVLHICALSHQELGSLPHIHTSCSF